MLRSDTFFVLFSFKAPGLRLVGMVAAVFVAAPFAFNLVMVWLVHRLTARSLFRVCAMRCDAQLIRILAKEFKNKEFAAWYLQHKSATLATTFFSAAKPVCWHSLAWHLRCCLMPVM
jgi:hypothetical protein